MKSSSNNKTFLKMNFIYKSIENGWTVNKKNDLYIFIKDHEGKKEVLTEKYLKQFIMSNSCFK